MGREYLNVGIVAEFSTQITIAMIEKGFFKTQEEVAGGFKLIHKTISDPDVSDE